MTVGELLHRMSSREFLEWQALGNLEHEERIEAELRRRVAENIEDPARGHR